MMNLVTLISGYLPFFWLAVAVILGIIEALTVDLVAVWFCAGSIVAILPAVFKLPFWVQVLTCLVVGIILLIFTRPFFVVKVLKVKKTRTNADQVIGMTAYVVEDIDNIAERGRVHVNGLDWSARSDDGAPIPKGESVLVRQISGVKLIVERI